MSFTSLSDLVPSLHRDLYKGKCGKIGIIGGSLRYTGAPYFAGISALRMGADLVHVFCEQSAAAPIKSYSPELIVHPVFDDETDGEGEAAEMQAQCVISWIPRLSALVIGCGMGFGSSIFRASCVIIKEARKANLPLVLDGDGVNLILRDPSLVKGYRNCVLTPNFMEFMRLWALLGPEDKGSLNSRSENRTENIEAAKFIGVALGGVTVVQKGAVDVITNGDTVLLEDHGSSPRRCGGQGDVLAGCISLFLAWAVRAEGAEINEIPVPRQVLAAYGGSYLVRECSKRAFKKFKRGMITTDIIQQLCGVFEELFPAVE